MLIILLVLVITLIASAFYFQTRYFLTLNRALKFNRLNPEISFLNPDKQLYARFWHLLWPKAAKDLNNLVSELVDFFKRYNALQQEQARSEKEFKEMIASIAHDFQTPLTAIQGACEILDLKLAAIENDNLANPEAVATKLQEFKHYLQLLHERSNNLSEQFKSFYLLATINSNDLPLQLQKCSLYDYLAAEIAANSEVIAEKFKNNVVVELNELQPVYQSSINLKRILANLFKNSLEHGRDYLKISLTSQGNEQIITIANGWMNPGLKDVSCLLKRSFRLDQARTQSSIPHAGLGLSIINELCYNSKIGLELAIQPYDTNFGKPGSELTTICLNQTKIVNEDSKNLTSFNNTHLEQNLAKIDHSRNGSDDGSSDDSKASLNELMIILKVSDYNADNAKNLTT